MDKDVKKILQIVEENNHQGYIVGGYVRDHLLGIENEDIDLCSSMTPDEIEDNFEVTSNQGKSFGSMIIKLGNNEYEITTFRVDNYNKSRFPEVKFIDDVKLDSVRRDFTINALYMDVNGEVLDFHYGIADLNSKKLKFIGNYQERIAEDPLRIVRAIRFAEKLDFEIENWEEIKQLIYKLKSVSKKRIKREEQKIENNSNRYVQEYLQLKSDLEIDTIN